MDHKRGSFSGKIGFVLSAAGASVGLGNIWRFPYLAAKYGGAIFLLVYIILAMTFGYTMIIAETSIGRMTGKSPVGAYKTFSDKPALRVGGWINAIIPILIVPYYSVIGGWVIKYLAEYLMGKAHLVAEDGYFSSFISNGVSSELCFLVFTAMTLAIIFAGVENGIERVSKIMMPILVVLSLIIAVYSVTRPGALEGVKYFLVPNLDNFSWMTVVSAMGQMFYSLSIAMGILITFGSYMKKDVPIEISTRNVEVFDTAIAIMAGLMIIPAVFAFSGGDPSALKAGPSLMFITIPKVFDSMGLGTPIGILFFLPLVGVPNSAYGKFHANQGLILLIFDVVLSVASWIVQAVLEMIPIIGGILSGLVQLAVSVCVIALFVFGVVQAAQGKAKTLPVIGKFHLIG